MKITVETVIAAPLDKVWHTYTNPEDIKQWNAASEGWHTTASTVDLREGGTFFSRMEAKDGSAGVDFSGTYTKIVPHQCIEYTFGNRAAQVEFLKKQEGIHVLVTFDSEEINSLEQQRNGWQAILDNFAHYVTTKG